MQNPTITRDWQVHTEIGKTQVDLGKPKPRSASPGRDPTVNYHAPCLDQDRSPLHTHHAECRDQNPLPTNQTKNSRWGFRVLQNKVPNLEIYGFRESITNGRAEKKSRKSFRESRTEGKRCWLWSFWRAEGKKKWRERKKSAEMKERAKKKLK